MKDTYTVHVKGAIPGSDFTLYLNSYPQPIIGGKASGEEFEFEVQSEFTGEGKIKVFGRLPSRTTQNFAYSIPVTLYNKDNQTIWFKKESHTAPTESEPVSEPVKEPEPIVEEETKDAVETIQDLTKNELREKIQKKNSGNSFWDNLK